MYQNRFWKNRSLLHSGLFQDFIHYFIQDFIHYFIQGFIQEHMHFLSNWSFTTFTSILATANAQNYWSAHKFWGPGYIIPTTLFGDDTGSISIVGIRVIPINNIFMYHGVVKGSVEVSSWSEPRIRLPVYVAHMISSTLIKSRVFVVFWSIFGRIFLLDFWSTF